MAGNIKKPSLAKATSIAYSTRLAEHICAEVASGAPLTQVAGSPGVPSLTTLYRWMRKHEEFGDMMNHARMDMGDTFAHRVIEEIDKTTPVNAQAQKVKLDSLRWIAAVHNRRYSEKVNVQHGGELAGKMVIVHAAAPALPERTEPEAGTEPPPQIDG